MAYYACREVGERGNAAHLLVREACGDVQFLCDAAAHKWPYDRSGLVTAPIERILDQNPLLVRQLAVPPGWNVDLNGVGLWQNRINDPEHGRRVLPPTATADEMMAYLQIADINVDIGFMLEIYEDFYPIRETDVPILERFLASDSIENRGSVLETLVERGKFNGYEADLTLLWFQSREGTYQGRPVEYSPLNGLSKLRDRGSPVAKRIYDLVAKTDAFEQLY